MTEHPDVERAQDAEREVERSRAEGKPLARDVLEKFMLLFASLASRFQPGSVKEPNRHADDALFRLWSGRAVDCAKALAPYQSATMRAIAVAPPPQSEQITTRRFTLRIFDKGLTTMSTEELVREYRARIAAGPVEPDPNFKPAEPSPALPAPSAPSVPDAAPSVRVPEAASMPVVTGAPVELAEEPVEELVATEPKLPAPVAQPAAPPNVFRFPEAPKTVQEYADSIASAVGPDGRPRAVNAKAISQAALGRAAMPSTRSAGMPRWSGVSDR